jgi:integrase
LDAGASALEIGHAARAEWGQLAPGTLKRYLAQLRAIFNVAYDDGLIDRTPRIGMPYVNDVVEVDVSAEQVALLLSYIKWTEPRWYPLVLVLAHTGARLGEALAITPERSFTRRGVRIEKRVGRRTKTVVRTVPYTPLLAKEVASGAFGNGLLPKEITPRSAPACLGRVLELSCTALAIPRLRVHDLRHAFAAILAEKGADLADIATALGHSNIQMAMRYRGLVRARLHAVMAGI